MLRKMFMLKLISWVVLSPAYAMAAQLTVSDFSKTGDKETTVIDTFKYILASKDEACKSWLTGVDETIPQLIGHGPASLVGHGKFNSNVAAFTGNVASTGLPEGVLMVFNDDSAYYNSKFNTAGIEGGSAEARVAITLHELGHLLSAAGFQNDATNGKPDQRKVDSNDALVKKNCSQLLKAARKK
jgi:hypothetical protein